MRKLSEMSQAERALEYECSSLRNEDVGRITFGEACRRHGRAAVVRAIGRRIVRLDLPNEAGADPRNALPDLTMTTVHQSM